MCIFSEIVRAARVAKGAGGVAPRFLTANAGGAKLFAVASWFELMHGPSLKNLQGRGVWYEEGLSIRNQRVACFHVRLSIECKRAHNNSYAILTKGEANAR